MIKCKNDYDLILLSNLNWGEFRNKKILITGASGLIGGYLSRFMSYLSFEKDLNIKIFGVARSEIPFLNDRRYYKQEITHLKWDLRNPITTDLSFDQIFHCASPASPINYVNDPLSVILLNTVATLNLIKLLRNSNSNFVYLSTTGVVGSIDDDQRPIGEFQYGPLDHTRKENIYAESKRMGEAICFAYARQHGLNIRVTRPSITFGPGVSFSDGRAFADFTRAVVNRENIKLRTDGKVLRNFLYVADFISGLLYVLLKGNSLTPYNITNSEEMSIAEMARMLVQEIFPERNLKVEFESEQISTVSGPFLSRTSVLNERVESLGWKKKFNYVDAFRSTVSYYDES
jgi:UDP-glucuronate decarboxylase